MSQNLKNKFLNEVKLAIADHPEPDQLFAKISILLEGYEMTERVTDLVPAEDENLNLIKLYISSIAIDGKAKSTATHYTRELKKFMAEFYGRDLKDLGSFDVRNYLAKKKMAGLSNRTLDNVLTVISAFYGWLAAEEYIQKNPCASIKPIKFTMELKHPFSTVELDAMRSACKKKRERAMVEFLLASGVRVSEFCDLDVADIDFVSGSVHVRHGKGDKERYTYINDLAKDHLQKYLDGRTTGPLFMTQLGGRYTKSGVQYVLHSVGDRAGVSDVHPHRFRRTFATTLASRGMALQEIQKLMGHSNINTTMVYITLTDQEAKLSYAKYA